MTIHLVTFASPEYQRSAHLCRESAKRNGANNAETATFVELQHTDIYDQNKTLFDSPRGAGFWAWKPLLISRQMRSRRDGDILIYADAGIEFINNVNYIIDRMDQDIFLFGNNWEHKFWCKRDVIDAIMPLDYILNHLDRKFLVADSGDVVTTHWGNFGKQVQASVIFFRVSDYSRRFVKEWLDWCLFEGGRLIDDSPSRTPNHPEFREHRHDQAILTTLAYREGITLHYWPATYNDGAFNYEKLPEYAGDDYPILFHHHRRRNVDWEQAMPTAIARH